MRAVGDVTPSITRRVRPRPTRAGLGYAVEWTTQYQSEDIGSALSGNGAAFDLLDFRRMYRDAAGEQPVTAYGDTVARIDSHDGSSRLVTDGPSLATVRNLNGYPALKFGSSRYRIEGFNPAVTRPAIAHGTHGASSATEVLYWYNNSGTGYGGRKWGVLIRPSQYRMFYRDSNINVYGVDSWAPYHAVYLNRPGDVVSVDGVASTYSLGSETYGETDLGFRLGGYPGNNTEMFTGYLTHFVISGSSLDAEALDAMAARHRTLLNI